MKLQHYLAIIFIIVAVVLLGILSVNTIVQSDNENNMNKKSNKEESIIGSTDSQETSKAIFAGGCFWGVEYYFQNAAGVISTTVGYTGGRLDNPTYEDVCADKTGHAEAIEIIYNPKETNYEKLTKLFFEIHDFTQLNRQGPDIGTQYRSSIYYLDEEQKEIANRLVEDLKQKGYDIRTEIKPAKQCWAGENYHQRYYEKNGKEPYCHVYKKIF